MDVYIEVREQTHPLVGCGDLHLDGGPCGESRTHSLGSEVEAK
jgi:hypothetical protein